MSWLPNYFRTGLRFVAAAGLVQQFQQTLDFEGSGVSVAADPTNNQIKVTIPGGGSGPSQGSVTLGNGVNSNIPIAVNTSMRAGLGGGVTTPKLGGFSPTSGAPTTGQTLSLLYTGNQILIIADSDGSSTYPIKTGTGGPVQIPPRPTTLTFIYDGSANVWRLQSAGLTAPRIFDVRDFGAFGNARFFNNSNFKWYQDGAFVVEASDDAPGFQAAVNAAAATANGDVYIPPLPGGSWYFKSKQGSNGEFVRIPSSGVSIRGDGPASKVTIAPGFCTGVSPVGYLCVFGNADGAYSGTGVDLTGCTFTKFAVDHNSAGNQWHSANYSGTIQPSTCAAVLVCKGSQVFFNQVEDLNNNGKFSLVCGTYGGDGTDYTVSGFGISDCYVVNPHNDPNTGDASMIAVGAFDGYVTGVHVDATTFRPQMTALETHGRNFTVSNCHATFVHRLLNVAGDSLDASNITVQGCTTQSCDTGITLFNQDGHGIQGLTITGNIFGLVKSTLFQPTGSYGGVLGGDGDGVVVPYGTGYFQTKITNNQVIWQDLVNAVPNNVYGVNIVAGIVKRLTIQGNTFDGMGANGIGLGVGFSANHSPPNQWYNVYIGENIIHNCGIYGVSMAGGAGDSAVQFKKWTVCRNQIDDDRGGGSVLSIGVVNTAFTDNTCIIDWDNNVFGAAIAATFSDPTNYPSQATFLQSIRVADVDARAAVGLSAGGGTSIVQIRNTTAATVGTPTQDSQGISWFSSYYSAGLHNIEFRMWQTPAAHPVVFLDWFDNGVYNILAELSIDQFLCETNALSIATAGTTLWSVRTVSGFEVIYMAAAGIPGTPDLTNFTLLGSAGSTQLNVPSGGTVNMCVAGNPRFAATQGGCTISADITYNMPVATAPGTPAANTFIMYIDSADNKLKIKGSSGTVTIIAVP